MPKPQARKATAFEMTQSRSVFLTGDPNKEKLEILKEIQVNYTNAVNQYITLLNDTPSLLLPLIKNDKKNGDMRAFEKAHRIDVLKSALSQAAFDDAVTMHSNRLENILQQMRTVNYNLFTQSKVLFVMSVQGKSKAEMIDAMNDIASKTKNNEFYQNAAEELSLMPQGEFDLRMDEFSMAYADATSLFRVPCVKKKMWVSLDSRTCILEEAVQVKTSHVLTVINPGASRERISIPLRTSENSLRRLRQYGLIKSCRYTITDKGQLRVSVAFKKKKEQPKTGTTNGVDTGIVDCLYGSDGKHYGSFNDVENFYKTVVEPSFGELSSLRNKKRKILHYLHTHKSLPDSVRRSLLDKVNKLEGMIKAAREPYHKLRSYYHQQDAEISRTVMRYIRGIDRSTLTVLEMLDIREFDKSRKANGKLYMFARGQLQRKLIAALNWYGYDYMEVDPAYTSQLCPVCSCVDRKNRNGKKFRCVCCGHEQDADYNAAINIRARAEDSEIRKVCEDNRYNTNKRHAALKKLYAKRHNEWIQSHQNHGIQAAANTL